jgi:hypothetical protein
MNAQVIDSFSLLSYTYSYINSFDHPSEAIFFFPTFPEITITSLIIKIDDKIIEGKITKL